MIAFLRGRLAGKTATSAHIDVNGVGYEVGMSQTGLAKLPAMGEAVEVQTYLQVREDGAALYGFVTVEEKALFEQLIGVAGVGPKVALAALSAFSPQALTSAIATQDVASVQKIPGVGKKTASRIILELKGSLEQVLDDRSAPAASTSTAKAGLRGAHEALLSMGFTSAEADLALKDAPDVDDEGVLLHYALKRLGS